MFFPLLAVACAPLAGHYPERAEYPVREAEELSTASPDPTSLRVLTWNIKFGGARVDFFFDGWGDRVHMTTAEVTEHMDDIVKLINDVHPDLLLTQEVDIGSKRSAYLDQVDHILNGTGMNYAAWVPVWESIYIAEEGLGPMQMGQAVFSRHPITFNERISLEPIEDQDALTQFFYLDRCIQRVTVDLGAAQIEVLNNHPDAYATDGTKERQIDDIIAEAAAIDGPLLVGGDFNAVPPGTLNLTDFADNAPVSGPGYEMVTYEEEGDLLLEELYEAYTPAISLAAYQVDDQEPFFTHSISSEVFWNRKLDYLFAKTSWSEAQTVQSFGDGVEIDPMDLSDHAPVFGLLELE